MTMQRRSFITLLGGAAAAWPLEAGAQQDGRVRRVGLLRNAAEDTEGEQARSTAFLEGMRQAGWIEGRNLRFDARFPGFDAARVRIEAAEMVALAPDVIVTANTLTTTIVGEQTKTIPIVMAGAGDAPSVGIVANMARPSGNITGFTSYELSLGGKWLELLKEVAPSITRVALVYTRGGPSSESVLHTIEAAAPGVAIRTTAIPATNPVEIERAIGAFARAADGGLMVLPGPGPVVHRELLIALALRHRLPSVYSGQDSIRIGGMMSYSADIVDIYGRTASYVDRILRGAKPADLPIQAPTKYRLLVNLKAAKAIGLTIPESFLLRADEVIE
jgi:putative ABC transport system substrate-binding protein